MKTEREMFEESNNIKSDWSFKFDDELQQYVELDHEMQAQVEEFNEHWDTFRAGWQAAKAQAVPECKWTQNEDDYFDAACGQSFVFSEPEDKPSKHKFTHCCFCGGRLVEAKEQNG